MTYFFLYSFLSGGIYGKVVKKYKLNYLELVSCGGHGAIYSLLIQLL